MCGCEHVIQTLVTFLFLIGIIRDYIVLGIAIIFHKQRK